MMIELKSGKMSVLDSFCMFVFGVGFGVWMGVGCPCPPVRNYIVTPRHLFFNHRSVFIVSVILSRCVFQEEILSMLTSTTFRIDILRCINRYILSKLLYIVELGRIQLSFFERQYERAAFVVCTVIVSYLTASMSAQKNITRTIG